MRAITVLPGHSGSLALTEVDEPIRAEDELLVDAVAVGVCGTDREIIAGEYGAAPPGSERLILGHESLGKVRVAPEGSGFAPGDYVVGIVRHPDPVPCQHCAVGEWDMCSNGRFTEHGIQGLHGFAAERWTIAAKYAIKVEPSLGELGVLLEPASVLAKAWAHIDAIGRRAHFAPEKVLVIGAGPIGLLATLFGVQRGLEVHVIDIVDEGLKPELVRSLGAHYHHRPVSEIVPATSIVVECTGLGALVVEAISATPANSIVCLTGISSGGRKVSLDMSMLNRNLVLENDVIFGTVNANRRHYELASSALCAAPRAWLARLVNRRVPLEDFADAYQRHADDVKTIVEFPPR